jgi:hypothetical protein
VKKWWYDMSNNNNNDDDNMSEEEKEAARREWNDGQKELTKKFYEHFLDSYLNRNNSDPSWYKTKHPDGSYTVKHILANPTLEHFNEAVKQLAYPFKVPLCSEDPSIPLVKGQEDDIIIEGNKIKQEEGHSFTYQRIVEKVTKVDKKTNKPKTMTALYECRHCGLWRLEEKPSNWKGD